MPDGTPPAAPAPVLEEMPPAAAVPVLEEAPQAAAPVLEEVPQAGAPVVDETPPAAPAPVLEAKCILEKRRPGAPPKLTEARRRLLLEQLAVGVYRKHACTALGIVPGTLANTMKRDAAFKAQVVQAEMMATLAATRCLTDAAATDPKFALEYLARRHPDQWGKRMRIKLDPTTIGRSGRDLLDALAAKLGVPVSTGALELPEATEDG